MKKILFDALMTCATFLAPASGFCMEIEEPHLSGPMKALPKDLHIVVSGNLCEAKDVVSLKRVNRFFYDLVKTTKKIVNLQIVLNTDNEKDYGKKYSSFKHNFYLEADKENPAIFLGCFTISEQNGFLIEQPIVLPFIKDGIFLAQSISTGVYGHQYYYAPELYSYASPSRGYRAVRFIDVNDKKPTVQKKPTPYWLTEIQKSMDISMDVEEPFVFSPTKILDGSCIRLEVKIVNMPDVEHPSYCYDTQAIEYHVHQPEVGQNLPLVINVTSSD